MELADVKLFAGTLLAACEATEKAGKSSLDTNFFLSENGKMKREDMTRIVKDVFERLHDPLTLPGFIEAEWTASSPFLSPGLHELLVWFDCLREKTDKSLQGRIRERFYQLLFYQMKNLSDFYTRDGAQTLADMIPNSGNLDKVSVKEQLSVYIENGEKYHSLSNDLGGPGTLFLLPDKGESYWLSKVPKGATPRGQKTRVSVLESLLQTGISSRAIELNTHTVAAKILDDTLSVFRDALMLYLGACGDNSNAQYVSHQPSSSLNCLFYAPHSDAQALLDRRPDASCSGEPHKRRCTGNGVTSGSVGAEDVLNISTQETEFVALSLHPEDQHKEAPRATNRDPVPDESGTSLSLETIPVQAPGDNTNNPLRVFMAPFVMEPTDHVQLDAYGSSISPADHPQTNPYDLNIVPADYPQIYMYGPNLEPDDHPQTYPCEINILPTDYPQIYPFDLNLVPDDQSQYEVNILPADYPQIYPFDLNPVPNDHLQTYPYEVNILPADYPQTYMYDPNLEPDNHLQTYPCEINILPANYPQIYPFDLSLVPDDHSQTYPYEVNILPANYPQIYPFDLNLVPNDHSQTYPYEVNILPANYPQIYPFNLNLVPDDHPQIFPYELDDILAVAQHPYTSSPETSQSSCFPWLLSVSSAEFSYPKPRIEVI
ncbi:hypothetical protein ASPCAL13780 [Aspergillus calidoustus]|uniref:Uncharacterized protein n=1 Tax=Aspergillus calidoustus TaxID=454130 RepID=A0A0U5GIE4_ASPCI|nr:hypothetical protein ASPCAL13780 [Aspergillus calidoustus]